MEHGATTFRPAWGDHVSAFFNYARGVATNDTAGRDQAKTQLVGFENGLADF